MSEFRRSSHDGQTFVYADTGEGPLLVLLHGFPDTPHSWDGIRSRLNGEGFRTVVPYLRGYHPETVVPGRGYGAATTAADALRLLDSLGEQCAVLIGHDWGASIAYAVAHLHPERARAIVPIAIPPPHLLRPTPGLLFRTRHFLALRVPWAESAVRRGARPRGVPRPGQGLFPRPGRAPRCARLLPRLVSPGEPGRRRPCRRPRPGRRRHQGCH